MSYSLEFLVFLTSETREIQNISGTFPGRFLERVKLRKFMSSFYLWNLLLFARVKLGKYTNMNIPLGTFTILENLPCLSCVYSLCFSWEIHKILTCIVLEFCLEGSESGSRGRAGIKNNS